MSNDLVVVRLGAARLALREAKTLQDKKKLMDIGEALETFARRQNATEEVRADAHAFHIETVRLLGEAMLAQPKATGAAGIGKSISAVPEQYRTQPPTLAELGIDKKVSAAAQKLASLPPEQFAQVVAGSATIAEAIKQVASNTIAAERAELLSRAKTAKPSERWKIHCADVAKFNTDRKFDWIITDPPYPKEFLPLYETLAERARELLKDGGLLVAMCGQSHIDEIYQRLSVHLRYYWTAAYLTPGQPTPLRHTNVNTTWKPLLIFAKGNYSGKIFGDVFRSDGNDKSFHKWGQSESGMTDIVSKLSLAGESILDPFCGAGTTGIAALRHGCFFEGIDIDGENCKLSIARLASEMPT